MSASVIPQAASELVRCTYLLMELNIPNRRGTSGMYVSKTAGPIELHADPDSQRCDYTLLLM